MHLQGVMLGSQDAGRLIGYYTALFGEPGFTGDGFAGWQLGAGWLVMGPHDEVRGANSHPGRIMWNLETADVRADFARLAAAGAVVVREPYQPQEGSWIATLSDPDGNYFQLMSPM